MTNETIEYNHRQIKLMENKLDSFKNGTINLYELMTDLTGLLHCIQNYGKEWGEKFQSQLGTLDTVYANFIYENRTTYTELEQNLINISIKKIHRLIEEFKEKNQE